MQRPKNDQTPNFEGVTREQLKKIERSLKKPQFMGLLNEYMVEISDPKNKAEYDEYLKQMDKEGELPKHMKLIKITPQFCFRTHLISNSNKRHQMKFFINVCSSDYMQKPTCEPAPTEDGKVGYSWKIPNSMGKIRYDQDKHGNVCQTVDAAFHPDNFKMISNPAFQSMIISITLESAQKQLGERKETLSKDYNILKNIKCKGGEPALLPVRLIEGKIYNKGDGPSEIQQRSMEGKQTKLQKELTKQKQQHLKKQGKKQLVQEKQTQEVIDLDEGNKMVEQIGNEGPQRPKVSSIYTYPIDYTEFMESPNNAIASGSKIPSVFNLQFLLPKIQRFEEIVSIEISEFKVVLDGGKKYFIDVSFEQFKIKYVLMTEKAKAKYDKKKRILKIVIPINQQHAKSVLQKEQKLNQYNKSIKQNQDEKQNQIVENQTWKNQVLECTNTNINLQFIQTNELKNAPETTKTKLIEEIDEDDQIQNSKRQQQPNEDPVFNVAKYYQSATKNSYMDIDEDISFNIIPYFLENTDSAYVIIAKIRNYQKQELISCFNSNQILIKWANTGSSAFYLHLKFQNPFQIDQISLIYRVNFVGIVLNKKQQLQNKTENIISDAILKYSTEGKQKEQFEANFNRVKKQQNQRNTEIIKQQQLNEQIKSEQNHTVNQKQIIRVTIDESLDNGQNSVGNTNDNERNNQKLDEMMKETNIFSRANPQFITFNLSFIDSLD